MKRLLTVLEFLAPIVAGFTLFRGPLGTVTAVVLTGFSWYRIGYHSGRIAAEHEYILKQLTKPY